MMGFDLVTAARIVVGSRPPRLRWLLGHEMVSNLLMDDLRASLAAMPDSGAVVSRSDILAAASILGGSHPRLVERLVRAARWPL